MSRWACLALPCVLTAALQAQDRPQRGGQDPPRFRSGIEVVALDVTVVDRAGKPALDALRALGRGLLMNREVARDGCRTGAGRSCWW